MKTYIDYNDRTILYSGRYIPKDPLNSEYAKFLLELTSGEAELIQPQQSLPTWEQIRARRDQLLQESDWIGGSDVQLKNKNEWVSYRQQLRTIPQRFSRPQDVIWPTKPQ